ncbi:MAG: [protein-PII] uridylyltransferase, partial [Actinomycetota bacterium]|nr:[protein-PII] uridylyltransferase [Actinomycetota bacterium]
MALIRLFQEATPPLGTAIAALGGYGRERQFPHSDIDLLILHDGRETEGVARLADRMLYPLWDAGFEVGHAVRTPSECLLAADERLDVLTAMLDARFLDGDRDLLEGAMERVRLAAGVDVPVFVRALRDAALERAERFGSAAHLLEPDLKEGDGGLRDIASFAWIERVRGTTLAPEILRPSEHHGVEAAEEFLTRARSAVHLLAGKRTDRLTSELQTPVATHMGYTGEPLLTAPDALIRAVFEHARTVTYVRDRVFDRILDPDVAPEDAPAYPIIDGQDVLSMLAGVAEEGGDIPPRLLEAIEDTHLPDPVLWTDPARDAFMTLLRLGRPGARMLEALDRLDLLRRFLPAWAAVRCRPQRDPYHRFSVDRHLTEAFVGMAGMIREHEHLDPDDPFEAEVMDAVGSHDGLLLGALFHDIGKNGGGNHVPAGAEIAAASLRAM